MTKRVEAYGNALSTEKTRVRASTTVKASAGLLEKIIVFNNGSDKTLTLLDGATELGSVVLDGDVPRTIDLDFNCDTSIITNISGAASATRWYKLDSTSGAVVTDSGTDGTNGVYVNGESADWVQGKVGQCLDFDGTDEHITAANVITSTGTTPFSIAFWVWADVPVGGGVQEFFNASGAGGVIINISNSGWVQFQIGKNGTFYNRIFYESALPAGAWHHLAFTYDASGYAAGMKIYLDGAEQTIAIHKDTMGAQTMNVAGTHYIGTYGGGRYFNGKIDDFRHYAAELSSTEVEWIYNSGSGRDTDSVAADLLVVYD